MDTILLSCYGDDTRVTSLLRFFNMDQALSLSTAIYRTINSAHTHTHTHTHTHQIKGRLVIIEFLYSKGIENLVESD